MRMKLTKRLGFCVICGDRVLSEEAFVESEDGYCHHNCLADASATA